SVPGESAEPRTLDGAEAAAALRAMIASPVGYIQNSKTRSARSSLGLDRGVGHAFFRLESIVFDPIERDPDRKNKRGRACAVTLGIESGRFDAFFQFERRLAQAMPRHDDRVVRRHQVFLGPVLNPPHPLLHGGILHRDTTNTAVGSAALLSGAVDHIVIVLVDDRPE